MEGDVQHLNCRGLAPGVAPVRAAKDAAARGGENHLAVIGVNGETAYILEGSVGSRRELGPGVATIGGLKDPGPANGINVVGAFAGASVDDICIGRVHHHAGHRQVRHEIVQREPGGAAVGGFPNPAVHPAAPQDVGKRWMRQQRPHASADVARPQPRPAVGLNAGRQRPWRAGIRLDGRRVRRGGKQIAVHRNVPAVFERAQQTIGRDPPMFIHHAQRPEFLFLGVFVNAGMLQIQQHRLQLDGRQPQQAVVAEIEPRPQIVQLLHVQPELRCQRGVRHRPPLRQGAPRHQKAHQRQNASPSQIPCFSELMLSQLDTIATLSGFSSCFFFQTQSVSDGGPRCIERTASSPQPSPPEEEREASSGTRLH